MKIKYFYLGEVRFTLKQMKYLSKLRDGKRHKEIAAFFGVSVGTVDHTIAYLVKKAKADSAPALVAFCTTHGLAPKGIFNGKDLFKIKVKAAPKKKSPRKD